jgi:Mg2+-importing ATPase
VGTITQTLIFHLLRTEKIPFLKSIASWHLIASTIFITTISIIIPTTFLGAFISLKQGINP